MFGLGKRIIGEFVVLLILVQLAYLLLYFLSNFSLNGRMVVVSILLVALSVLIVKSR